jgi:hypothetical protein
MGASRVAVALTSGFVYVIDRGERRAWRVSEALRGSVTALGLSHDERCVYVGTESGQVRVYRA